MKPTSFQANISDGIIGIRAFTGNNGEYLEIKITGTSSGTYHSAIVSYHPTAEGPYYINNPEQSYAAQLYINIDEENHTLSGTLQSHVSCIYCPAPAAVSKTFKDGVFKNIPYTEEPGMFSHAVSATTNTGLQLTQTMHTLMVI